MLDPHLQLHFVNGGGVEVVYDPSHSAYNLDYMEVGLNLPVGARVTSIAVSCKSCASVSFPIANFLFGSYAPATRNTIQNLTFKGPRACTPTTVTKTRDPITTTLAGRRYVLDVDDDLL